MHTKGGIWLRRGLVVFQFGISVLLEIGILVMDRQMEFIQNKDLGFTRQNILITTPLRTRPDLIPRLREIRQEFARHPAILSSTGTLGLPGLPNESNVAVFVPEGLGEEEFRIRMLGVDEDFLATYEIPLLSGRNFSATIASDSTQAFLLSEKAVKTFGWDNQSALGKSIVWPARESMGRPRGRVIGVFRDFHVNSLHHPMRPVILAVWNQKLLGFGLRYQPGTRENVVAHVKEAWARYNQDRPAEYHDLNEMIGWFYWQDAQLTRTSRVFGLIALAVACLGLLGLTAFTTQQRLKEIGIRKVLGGTAASLVHLLTREVVALVLLANILAAPFGFLLLSNWLDNFKYRIELGFVSFLYATLLTLLIAIITVSYQTLSAVRTDPVKVLRTE